MNVELYRFLRNALIPYYPNPGGVNIDAVLVIGGAAVWGICAVYAQVCGVVLLPEVSEIGKACIFVGIGRASKGDSKEALEKGKAEKTEGS
jgi:hypothetical protein